METEPTNDWSDISDEIEAVREIDLYNPLLSWGMLVYPHLLVKILIWPKDWQHGDDERLDEAVTAHLAQLEDITRPTIFEEEEPMNDDHEQMLEIILDQLDNEGLDPEDRAAAGERVSQMSYEELKKAYPHLVD